MLRIAFLLFLTLGIAGCSRKDAANPKVETAQDLVGRKIAVVVGSMMGDMTLKVQPGIGIEWFNDYNSGIEAVRLGKIAAMPLDFFYARRWAEQSPDQFAITKPYHSIPWGYLFPKGSPLRDRANAVLEKMRASGDLDRILKKWSEAPDPGNLPLEKLDWRKDFTGKAGVLRFATPADREPVSFVRANDVAGFDIDIVKRIAYELDMTFELVKITMGALVPAVQNGKADMGGGGIAITEERAKSVDFSSCYYRVPTVFLIGANRSSASGDFADVNSVHDLKGRKCGVVTGSAMLEIVEKCQPGVVFSSFNDYPSAVEALRLGKVDAIPLDTVVLRRWVANRPGEFRVVGRFADNPYGYFFQKGSPLREKVNAVFARLKASGELKRVVDKWCEATDLASVKPEAWKHPNFTGAGGVLRFATTGEYEPGSFTRQDEVVGFDIDLARYIAGELNMKFEILRVNTSAIVPAVQSGKADMGGGCVTIVASRADKVDFSDCYLNDGFSLMVRRAKVKEGRAINSPADLKGAHVAHLSNNLHKEELKALQSDIVFDPYTEYAFAFESLRKGKIDAISLGRTYADIWMARFPGEFKVAFDYAEDTCAFLLPKGSPWTAKVSAELRRMNAAGETAAIIAKWCDAAKKGETPPMAKLPEPPAGAPTLRLASAAQAEPWCFASKGRPVGIDMEILDVIAHRLGVRLQPKIFSFGGMVDAVNGGKTDIANGGVYTGGRAFPTVDASEKYADEKMCILVRNEQWQGGEGGLGAFVRSLRDSFVRTFVTESRWRMMASGLGITLLITFLSALVGTLLAFPVWLARTARSRLIVAVAKGYIAVLQGTPVLVLLMVLFYIVFGQVDIDGIWVAVVGFSLNASAYVGEMLRTGIGSIPRGQTEAALALGYSPRRAFFRFVLPQAVRAILPVYRGELIGLLKSTSIVGYIAINDLTKASDLVRSRTYESFFPILTTAFIYFVAAWLLAQTLDRLGRRLDPGARSKKPSRA